MEFRGPDISGGEGCECKKRVLYLEKKIERLEEIVQEKDEIISCLKGKSRQTTMELLELQLQMVCDHLSILSSPPSHPQLTPWASPLDDNLEVSVFHSFYS